MSSLPRVGDQPTFPTIRIVDRSLFHLPIRRRRPEVSPERAARTRRDEAQGVLLFGMITAARNAATGY